MMTGKVMTRLPIKPIAWIDAFDVGEDSLNRDHHEILDLINEIGKMLIEKRDSGAVSQALNRLLDRAEKHFRDEEALMAEYDVPGLDAHRVTHTLLLTRLRYMIDGLTSGVLSSDDEELFSGLVRWFVDHSVKYDAKIKGML